MSALNEEQKANYEAFREQFLNGGYYGERFKDDPQVALDQLTSSALNRELLGPAYDLLVAELKAKIKQIETENDLLR
jgi:hypothetical protein